MPTTTEFTVHPFDAEPLWGADEHPLLVDDFDVAAEMLRDEQVDFIATYCNTDQEAAERWLRVWATVYAYDPETGESERLVAVIDPDGRVHFADDAKTVMSALVADGKWVNTTAVAATAWRIIREHDGEAVDDLNAIADALLAAGLNDVRIGQPADPTDPGFVTGDLKLDASDYGLKVSPPD